MMPLRNRNRRRLLRIDRDYLSEKRRNERNGYWATRNESHIDRSTRRTAIAIRWRIGLAAVRCTSRSTSAPLADTPPLRCESTTGARRPSGEGPSVLAAPATSRTFHDDSRTASRLAPPRTPDSARRLRPRLKRPDAFGTALSLPTTVCFFFSSL
nr:60S ribosomal protein L37B [Trichoderma atroviride]